MVTPAHALEWELIGAASKARAVRFKVCDVRVTFEDSKKFAVINLPHLSEDRNEEVVTSQTLLSARHTDELIYWADPRSKETKEFKALAKELYGDKWWSQIVPYVKVKLIPPAFGSKNSGILKVSVKIIANFADAIVDSISLPINPRSRVRLEQRCSS